MAITLLKTIQEQSGYGATILFTLTSDGGGTDLTGVLLDVSADLAAHNSIAVADIRILNLSIVTQGIAISLNWEDAQGDEHIITCPANQQIKECWEHMGGLKWNHATGKNGDINFAAINPASAAATDNAVITMKVRKRYTAPA